MCIDVGRAIHRLQKRSEQDGPFPCVHFPRRVFLFDIFADKPDLARRCRAEIGPAELLGHIVFSSWDRAVVFSNPARELGHIRPFRPVPGQQEEIGGIQKVIHQQRLVRKRLGRPARPRKIVRKALKPRAKGVRCFADKSTVLGLAAQVSLFLLIESQCALCAPTRQGADDLRRLLLTP